MSRIKKILNKHPFLFALSALIHHRKEKDYLRLFSDVQRAVTIDTKPNNLGKAPVCVFDATDKIGLFAFLRRVTEFLYYCDNMGFTPYIQWSNSDYFDETITFTDNPFEYFYKQPGNITLETLNYSSVVSYAPGKATIARSFISSHLSDPGKEFIEHMGAMINKYLFLNDEVNKAVNGFIAEKNICDDTLGVHIRGTDIKKVYKNHPVYVEPKDFYPYIDEAIGEYGFKRVFLATDDTDVLSEFLEHYNSIPVVYSETVVRGNGLLGIHKEAAFNKEISAYKEGVNALCDTYSLSMCGGIVSGTSHVSMFSRMIKSGAGKRFVCDKIISKGYHKKGINASKEKFDTGLQK